MFEDRIVPVFQDRSVPVSQDRSIPHQEIGAPLQTRKEESDTVCIDGLWICAYIWMDEYARARACARLCVCVLCVSLMRVCVSVCVLCVYV